MANSRFVLISQVLVAASVVAASPNLPAEDGQPHDHADAAVIAPGEADHFWVFAESADRLGKGSSFRIYVDPETHPEARASFAEYALGTGGALPMHRHDRTEEIAYILAGEGMVQFEREGELQEFAVSAGYVWLNPPGTWHAVRNTGDEPLSMVFATIPNDPHGLLSLFRRLGSEPGMEPNAIPPDEFARIAEQHDLILRSGKPGD